MDVDDGPAIVHSLMVQHSTERICWWCRLDPIDGSISSLAHPDYRYLCRKCRQIMEIFASHFARMHDMAPPAAREQFMRFIGIRCIAVKLEMQEMRERVDELLHRAHQNTAWVNGVPDARTTGEPRGTHAPRVEIPVQRTKKDVM